MTKRAIFTSCATNYIPKARVLAESVKQFHPEIDVFVLLADTPPQNLSLENEAFDTLVAAKDLDIENFDRWIFGHRIVEACTAVKPFMLRHLLEQGYDEVIYFDPDIAIFTTLEPIFDGFKKGSVLLTPHINEPEATTEAIKDNELNSLKHGLYNFGFVAVKNDETGRAYADWWAERCYFRCFDDIAGGNFTDQKWNDLVPVFFDNVHLLKHPGCNVATWNYAQRKLEGTLKDGITVNGEPFLFHHFTGFDSGAHILMRDKYGKDMPAALELSHWYVAACDKYSEEMLEAVAWAYGSYDDGRSVQAHHRALYRTRQDLRDSFPQPFSTAAQGKHKMCYADWLKNEGLFDYAPPIGEAVRPFRQFLRDTRFEFEGYVTRTARLKSWQKRGVLKLSGLVFGLANGKKAA
ncbi:MAG: hypothetical protein P8P30_06610 [Rickettsiales bacterium]|nr:hypothetical protein [Rickettsiales bacterium]